MFWRIHFKKSEIEKSKNTTLVYYECLLRCVLFYAGSFTDHYVMVPLNLPCQHYLQHFYFGHLFYSYYTQESKH